MRQDSEAFERWLRKIQRHAELERWTEREKLLQLELHLTGRAEQIYEVLPLDARTTFQKATDSLKQRLRPVQNDALLSAQLMKRKQKHGEPVEDYSQEFEARFEKSYGQRSGMDAASRELLK